MNKIIMAEVNDSYALLYVLFLGRKAFEGDGALQVGSITVSLRDDPEFRAEGTISKKGALSGMSSVYRAMELQVGDVINCEVTGLNHIVVSLYKSEIQGDILIAPRSIARPTTVHQRHALKSIHLELFHPENLNRWSPESEPDVYMAFGVLMQYTRFRYCCGLSKKIASLLGLNLDTKPDAILVCDDTREYLIAEFKIRTSMFKTNHKPDDVDVLIVWDHDIPNNDNLPGEIVCLRDIARNAARDLLDG